jgi:hypothetical protein
VSNLTLLVLLLVQSLSVLLRTAGLTNPYQLPSSLSPTMVLHSLDAPLNSSSSRDFAAGPPLGPLPPLCPHADWMLEGDDRPDSQADNDWHHAMRHLFGS